MIYLYHAYVGDASLRPAEEGAVSSPPPPANGLADSPAPAPPLRQKVVGFEAAYLKLKQVGQGQPWNAAVLDENMSKNRYRNILAYDHSRVVLREGAPGGSDYINASWLSGLKKPRAYIAAQAPIPTTLADFWWMIWHENVSAEDTRERKRGRG